MPSSAAITQVYLAAGMTLSGPVLREAESGEYGACRFELDGRAVVFRVAKTTPTKLGQFVTLWKRPGPGDAIAPLAAADRVDFVVVEVAQAGQRGQFVFDKSILIRKGVLSSADHPGKRAIRVYPPWTSPVAKDAVRTQQWQRHYFLYFSDSGSADPAQTRRLFGNASNP
jgi:hypothetical protein